MAIQTIYLLYIYINLIYTRFMSNQQIKIAIAHLKTAIKALKVDFKQSGKLRMAALIEIEALKQVIKYLESLSEK